MLKTFFGVANAVFKHKNKRETGRNTIFEEIKFYFTMTKEELLKQCRHYNGEERLPDSIKSIKLGMMFWIAEEFFVRCYDQYKDENLQLLEDTGVAKFRPVWEGKISDELIAFLFSYFTKSEDCWSEYVIKGFVGNTLRIYFGSTF